MKDLNIRKAIAKDIDAVAELYEKIHLAEERGQMTIGWKRGIYPVRVTAEDALRRQDLFVEEAEGCIVGTAILNQTQVDVYEKARWQYAASDEQVMVMHTLVIDPDVKGQGLGRFFAEFYETYARQQGCLYLRIDTNARNAHARKFYQKLGYKEVDILPCVFNGLEGVNLVLLEKKLKEDS